MNLVRWFFLVLLACACGEAVLDDARAAIEVAPTHLDFGSVLVGREARRTLQIRNAGRAEASVSIVRAPEGYAMDPPAVAVAPGALVEVAIRFAPREAGEYAGAIELSAGPAVAVEGSGTPRAIETEALLDFGPVPVGGEKVLPLDVANLSDLPASVGVEVVGTDSESFTPGAGRLSVPGAGAARIEVRFVPLVGGPLAARLRLAPCDGCETIEVALRGEGTEEAVVVSPASLDFGTVAPGESLRREVRVTSRGAETPWITGAALVQGPGAPFALVPRSYPVAVEGASVLLEVEFAPQVRGTWDGALRLELADRSVDVPVRGRAAMPSVIAMPAAIDLGALLPGQMRRATFQLLRAGTDPVAIRAIGVRGADAAAFTLRPARALPLELGEEPLPVEITFRADAAGPHAVELYVEAPDPLVVPASATVVPAGSACALEVAPRLDFGAVAAGSSRRLPVEVRNGAAAPCTIWGASVEGERFFLRGGSPMQTIPPGGSVEWSVEYAPLQPRAEDEGRLVFHRLGADPTAVEVDLRGAGTAAALVAVPDPLELGTQPLGSPSLHRLLLRNEGDGPLRIGALTASPELELVGAPALPFLIPAGRAQTLQLRFVPAVPGPFRGSIAVVGEGEPVPWIVPARGEVAGPCGACETPVASCPATIEAWVGEAVELQGAALHGSCAWSLRDAPPASVAVPGASGACSATFVPDEAGSYLLELAVAGDAGEASCTTEVRAALHEGLRVETRWDVAGDVDLHLLHPAAGSADSAASWFDPRWDCHFANPGPIWESAARADDPMLDRDDREGQGPEALRIDAPTIGVAYAVGVHRFAGGGHEGAIHATTRISCGGAVVAEVQSELASIYVLDPVGTVTFTAPGLCSFTPHDGSLVVVP